MLEQPIDWSAVEQEASEMLSSYIQINTVNPPGNEMQGARFLQEILQRESISCEIFESQPGRGNLITHFCGEKSSPTILLLHHLDVVPFEEDKWDHPPLSGKIINGEIWGRGALDCKSLGIMELMALILLKRQGFVPEREIILAATADEEAGGKWGIPWLMENFPEKLNAHYIINEGGGLGFATKSSNLHFCQVAEKGACWIRITFYGKPGHASLPHDANCVAEMARAIEAIAAYQAPIFITPPAERFIYGIANEQDFMKPETFLEILNQKNTHAIIEKIPPKTLQLIISSSLKNTFTPTITRAGNKTNVIPGECYCEIDCRMLPGSTPEDIVKSIDTILRAKGCKNFTVQILSESLPSESPSDTPLYKILEENFKKHDPKAKMVSYMSSGATDSRFFREKGVIAYGIQMESSLQAMEMMHGHNERITVTNLTKGITLFYDTLKKFCT